MKILFYDTETTGGGERDRLIQLGVKERGVAKPVVNALYTPPVPISIDSMTVHHITPKMVQGRPLFTEAAEYAGLKKVFEAPGTVAVAHNASFDLAMLAREGVVPSASICTYKVARALDKEEKIDSYRLQYLRYLLELDVEAVAHDAWGDVLVLEALFEHLLAKMVAEGAQEEDAIATMIEISSRPVLLTNFHFGKHNGKKIAEVAASDASYLEWLLKEKKKAPMGEEDWIYSLEHYLKETKPVASAEPF